MALKFLLILLILFGLLGNNPHVNKFCVADAVYYVKQMNFTIFLHSCCGSIEHFLATPNLLTCGLFPNNPNKINKISKNFKAINFGTITNSIR